METDDTLSRIAERWFPDQEGLGQVALLLANPHYVDENRILPGQKLNLPLINPANQTIQLNEGTFYALFGEYPSIRALQKAVSGMSRQNVRYTVMKTETPKGNSLFQVLIGAYGDQEGLDQALSGVKGKSR
ncbi:MAG: LysM peptidoglycan-binding domain-containing protein [Pseudomonadota bacterium]